MMRAAFALLASGAAAAAWLGGVPAPPATPEAPALPRAAAPSAAPAAAPAPAPAPSHDVGQPAAAPPLASVEAEVQAARRQGKGEQEVHRLRATRLPAAQVEAIVRMEAAEASWRQRMEALQAACAANIGCEDARASFTREELAKAAAYAPPALRQ